MPELSLPTTEHPAPREIFLFAGQSNMAAFGAGAEDLPEPHTMPEVPYWWTIQGRPNVPANTSGGVWQNLRPLDWPLPEAPGGCKRQRFGPEFGFVRQLHEQAPERRPAIVKVQMGGSCLADWYPGAAFHPAGLHRLQDEISAALAAAAPSEGIAGVIWFQGESDTQSQAAAESYGTRFREFLTRLREVTPLDHAPWIFVLPRFAAQPGNLAVRREVTRLAATLPRAGLVPTDDLTQIDGVHFDAAGILEIGRRAADIWLQRKTVAAS